MSHNLMQAVVLTVFSQPQIRELFSNSDYKVFKKYSDVFSNWIFEVLINKSTNFKVQGWCWGLGEFELESSRRESIFKLKDDEPTGFFTNIKLTILDKEAPKASHLELFYNRSCKIAVTPQKYLSFVSDQSGFWYKRKLKTVQSFLNVFETIFYVLTSFELMEQLSNADEGAENV